MNNVTVVEVLNNHNQVFNFNQMEQMLSQTNEQIPQTSSESIINSPRPGRSTNSCSSENAVASPRQSSRHQTRNASVIEESANGASSSSSHSESNDRTNDEIPQRSTTEGPNEGQRIKVRMTESEDGWPRRRPKRQEVVPPTTEQELASNYEHLVLPTTMQSRPPQPSMSNFVPTDIAMLPTRPQVKIQLFFTNTNISY